MEENTPQELSSFKPFGKRIMVSRHVPDVGGLQLTEEMRREAHPDIGLIRMVGDIGFFNKWIRGIRVGRRVHFTRYSPVKISTTDEEWIYVDVDNVLGIETE